MHRGLREFRYLQAEGLTASFITHVGSTNIVVVENSIGHGANAVQIIGRAIDRNEEVFVFSRREGVVIGLGWIIHRQNGDSHCSNIQRDLWSESATWFIDHQISEGISGRAYILVVVFWRRVGDGRTIGRNGHVTSPVCQINRSVESPGLQNLHWLIHFIKRCWITWNVLAVNQRLRRINIHGIENDLFILIDLPCDDDRSGRVDCRWWIIFWRDVQRDRQRCGVHQLQVRITRCIGNTSCESYGTGEILIEIQYRCKGECTICKESQFTSIDRSNWPTWTVGIDRQHFVGDNILRINCYALGISDSIQKASRVASNSISYEKRVFTQIGMVIDDFRIGNLRWRPGEKSDGVIFDFTTE